ncbi:MAG: hypothetical protein DRO88_10835, partial [Promethearchaeia archaeon]
YVNGSIKYQRRPKAGKMRFHVEKYYELSYSDEIPRKYMMMPYTLFRDFIIFSQLIFLLFIVLDSIAYEIWPEVTPQARIIWETFGKGPRKYLKDVSLVKHYEAKRTDMLQPRTSRKLNAVLVDSPATNPKLLDKFLQRLHKAGRSSESKNMKFESFIQMPENQILLQPLIKGNTVKYYLVKLTPKGGNPIWDRAPLIRDLMKGFQVGIKITRPQLYFFIKRFLDDNAEFYLEHIPISDKTVGDIAQLCKNKGHHWLVMQNELLYKDQWRYTLHPHMVTKFSYMIHHDNVFFTFFPDYPYKVPKFYCATQKLIHIIRSEGERFFSKWKSCKQFFEQPKIRKLFELPETKGFKISIYDRTGLRLLLQPDMDKFSVKCLYDALKSQNYLIQIRDPLSLDLPDYNWTLEKIYFRNYTLRSSFGKLGRYKKIMLNSGDKLKIEEKKTVLPSKNAGNFWKGPLNYKINQKNLEKSNGTNFVNINQLNLKQLKLLKDAISDPDPNKLVHLVKSNFSQINRSNLSKINSLKNSQADSIKPENKSLKFENIKPWLRYNLNKDQFNQIKEFFEISISKSNTVIEQMDKFSQEMKKLKVSMLNYQNLRSNAYLRFPIKYILGNTAKLIISEYKTRPTTNLQGLILPPNISISQSQNKEEIFKTILSVFQDAAKTIRNFIYQLINDIAYSSGQISQKALKIKGIMKAEKLNPPYGIQIKKIKTPEKINPTYIPQFLHSIIKSLRYISHVIIKESYIPVVKYMIGLTKSAPKNFSFQTDSSFKTFKSMNLKLNKTEKKQMEEIFEKYVKEIKEIFSLSKEISMGEIISAYSSLAKIKNLLENTLKDFKIKNSKLRLPAANKGKRQYENLLNIADSMENEGVKEAWERLTGQGAPERFGDNECQYWNKNYNSDDPNISKTIDYNSFQNSIKKTANEEITEFLESLYYTRNTITGVDFLKKFSVGYANYQLSNVFLLRLLDFQSKNFSSSKNPFQYQHMNPLKRVISEFSGFYAKVLKINSDLKSLIEQSFNSLKQSIKLVDNFKIEAKMVQKIGGLSPVLQTALSQEYKKNPLPYKISPSEAHEKMSDLLKHLIGEANRNMGLTYKEDFQDLPADKKGDITKLLKEWQKIVFLMKNRKNYYLDYEVDPDEYFQSESFKMNILEVDKIKNIPSSFVIILKNYGISANQNNWEKLFKELTEEYQTLNDELQKKIDLTKFNPNTFSFAWLYDQFYNKIDKILQDFNSDLVKKTLWYGNLEELKNVLSKTVKERYKIKTTIDYNRLAAQKINHYCSFLRKFHKLQNTCNQDPLDKYPVISLSLIQNLEKFWIKPFRKEKEQFDIKNFTYQDVENVPILKLENNTIKRQDIKPKSKYILTKDNSTDSIPPVFPAKSEQDTLKMLKALSHRVCKIEKIGTDKVQILQINADDEFQQFMNAVTEPLEVSQQNYKEARKLFNSVKKYIENNNLKSKIKNDKDLIIYYELAKQNIEKGFENIFTASHGQSHFIPFLVYGKKICLENLKELDPFPFPNQHIMIQTGNRPFYGNQRRRHHRNYIFGYYRKNGGKNHLDRIYYSSVIGPIDAGPQFLLTTSWKIQSAPFPLWNELDGIFRELRPGVFNSPKNDEILVGYNQKGNNDGIPANIYRTRIKVMLPHFCRNFKIKDFSQVLDENTKAEEIMQKITSNSFQINDKLGSEYYTNLNEYFDPKNSKDKNKVIDKKTLENFYQFAKFLSCKIFPINHPDITIDEIFDYLKNSSNTYRRVIAYLIATIILLFGKRNEIYLEISAHEKSRENNNPYHWEDFSIPIENFRVRISEKKRPVNYLKKSLKNSGKSSSKILKDNAADELKSIVNILLQEKRNNNSRNISDFIFHPNSSGKPNNLLSRFQQFMIGLLVPGDLKDFNSNNNLQFPLLSPVIEFTPSGKIKLAVPHVVMENIPFTPHGENVIRAGSDLGLRSLFSSALTHNSDPESPLNKKLEIISESLSKALHSQIDPQIRKLLHLSRIAEKEQKRVASSKGGSSLISRIQSKYSLEKKQKELARTASHMGLGQHHKIFDAFQTKKFNGSAPYIVNFQIEKLGNLESKANTPFSKEKNRWIHGMVQDHWEASCIQHRVAHRPVNPYYSSQFCSRCYRIGVKGFLLHRINDNAVWEMKEAPYKFVKANNVSKTPIKDYKQGSLSLKSRRLLSNLPKYLEIDKLIIKGIFAFIPQGSGNWFYCPHCDHFIDRDQNAAYNLAKYNSLMYHAAKIQLLLDRESNPLDNPLNITKRQNYILTNFISRKKSKKHWVNSLNGAVRSFLDGLNASLTDISAGYTFSNSSSVLQEFKEISKTTPAYTFFNNGLKEVLSRSLGHNFKDEYFHEIIFDPDEDISTNLDKTKSFVSNNINLFKEKDSRKNTAKKSTQKSAKKVTNEKPGWLPISL